MVSSPTCTAVRASISTPVGPTVCTVARHVTELATSSSSNSTATLDRASGWHSGMRSEVRLAPWMAAMRATPSTSPLPARPSAIRASVLGSITMRPCATATRTVAGLADTSTMWAWPWGSKWVNSVMGGDQQSWVKTVRKPNFETPWGSQGRGFAAYCTVPFEFCVHGPAPHPDCLHQPPLRPACPLAQHAALGPGHDRGVLCRPAEHRGPGRQPHGPGGTRDLACPG